MINPKINLGWRRKKPCLEALPVPELPRVCPAASQLRPGLSWRFHPQELKRCILNGPDRASEKCFGHIIGKQAGNERFICGSHSRLRLYNFQIVATPA